MTEEERAPRGEWLELTGRRVVVHAAKGSFAASRARTELEEAERAVGALEDVLQPPQDRRGGRVDVYLADPVDSAADTAAPEAAAPGQAFGDGGLVRIVHPELPALPVAWPLARVAIARWFGEAAAEAPLLVNGAAGLAAARTGSGPSVREADAAVYEQLMQATGAGAGGGMGMGGPMTMGAPASAPPSADGERPSGPPSIFPRLQPAAPGDAVDAPDPVATSFVGYLITSFGAEAFAQFLAGYDAAKRDESALSAFRQTLAALEEGWIGWLMKGGSGAQGLSSLFRFLTPLLLRYRWRLVEVAVWMAVGLAVTAAFPLLVRRLIDGPVADGDARGLLVLTVALLALPLVNFLAGIRRVYAEAVVRYRVGADLEERTFAHLQRLPHAFYGEARVGDVMSRLSQDLFIVREGLSQFASLFMALQAVVAIAVIFYMSVWMGLALLAMIPVFGATYFLLGGRVGQAGYAQQEAQGEVAATAQENLSAHAVVKAYGLEQRAVATYQGRVRAFVKAGLRTSLIMAAFESAVTLTAMLMTVLVIALGGYLVITGAFGVGTLVAFMTLLPSLFAPITSLAVALQMLQLANASLTRVRELLDAPVDIADSPGAVELPRLSREIVLENVTFGYDPAHPIFQEFSLRILAGRSVAIVGPSGSGKSTIANLLLRFWDPDEGRVLFDGHDLRDVTVSSLRGQIGLVFQETFVFDTTVRENIRLGRLDATDDEVAAAAEAARLTDWIRSLPAGYETLLGERGVRMSGGQRQRLAIARALLRDPPVLVLDEATSALDAQTEAGILATLAEVAKGRTTISITHRLSLAATADRIVVLEGGRLVEEGTHDELVGAGGLYARLYEEQTSHVVGDGRRPAIRVDRLRHIPLLAGLGNDALAAVAELLVLERFGADEVVARQGEPADRLFLIDRGQVDVVVERNGYERRVNTLNDGEFFGEMALISDQPRVATVKTTMPTDTYTLSRHDLRDLMGRERSVRDELTATIGRRRSALRAALSAVEPRDRAGATVSGGS
ncbi:MAG: ATP-binding cassette domain-containing protein [Thermoleophilia bacterium]|nr:ATP-binding cassette domain-containing protein [Thermoleophilia bacterium]